MHRAWGGTGRSFGPQRRSRPGLADRVMDELAAARALRTQVGSPALALCDKHFLLGTRARISPLQAATPKRG